MERPPAQIHPEEPLQSEELKEPSRITRRQVLTGAVGAVASTAVVGFGAHLHREYQEDGEEIEGFTPDATIEREEAHNERFEARVLLEIERMTLRYDQVQFYDEELQPVGHPVKLQDFVVDRDGKPYRLTPGKQNEKGILTEGFAGEWLRAVQENLALQYPDRTIAGRQHVSEDFRHAYNDVRFPELRQAIDAGEVTRYDELVRFYASQPAGLDDSRSRLQYLQDEFSLLDQVPGPIARGLKEQIIGIAAQESKFNDGLVSGAGARGILQFMPGTWSDYREDDPDSIDDFVVQVQVAGEFFSDLYRQVMHHLGSDAYEKLCAIFVDEAQAQEEVLLPLIVNAYNAGSYRVGAGMRRFLERADVNDLQPGKDLFMAASEYMRENSEPPLDRYGEYAQGYVTSVKAQTIVLATDPEEITLYRSVDQDIIMTRPQPRPGDRS